MKGSRTNRIHNNYQLFNSLRESSKTSDSRAPLFISQSFEQTLMDSYSQCMQTEQTQGSLLRVPKYNFKVTGPMKL